MRGIIKCLRSKIGGCGCVPVVCAGCGAVAGCLPDVCGPVCYRPRRLNLFTYPTGETVAGVHSGDSSVLVCMLKLTFYGSTRTIFAK